MVLSDARAVAVAVRTHKVLDDERERVERIDRYLRGDHDAPYTPRNATLEYRTLARRSRTNWLRLVVAAVEQALYVEGYRRTDSPGNVEGWANWQANRLDARQTEVYRTALGFGVAYVTVLPGDPAPVITGRSPRRSIAVYDDPVEDESPKYWLHVQKESANVWRWRLLDADASYRFVVTDGTPRLVDVEEHGLGVCPVVAFVNERDLDGRYCGEVEPLFDLQDRINQTAFDLLMAQTFGSFKVRTISGMEVPDDTSEAEAAREIAHNTVLVSASTDTKFGTLDATALDGYIASLDQAVRHFAATSQTPPHFLLGQVANLSAEALAAAEASLMRKVSERQKTFGESWEQVLRLAALAGGDTAGAADTEAQVVWRDTEARSLAATADALGKIATQLQVPVEALWSMIPGVSQQDVESWKLLRAQGDALGQIASLATAPEFTVADMTATMTQQAGINAGGNGAR